MSVEVLLIPAAMAAYAAWKAKEEVGPAHSVWVQTRLRDRDLLARSLRELGMEVTVDQEGLHAEAGDVRLRFTVNEDGVAVAHVDSGEVEKARELIHAVDQQYAALVQVALYERVKAKASKLGLTIESERIDENNALTLVLALNEVRQ